MNGPPPLFRAGLSDPGAVATYPDSRMLINSDIAATSPRLDYNILFQFAGLHTLWICGTGAGGRSNSAFACIIGVVYSRRLSFPRASSGWVSIDVDFPSVGSHVTNIWMREDGSPIDELLLATDPKFVLIDLGPVESNPPALRTVDDSFAVDPDSTGNSFAVLENDSAEALIALVSVAVGESPIPAYLFNTQGQAVVEAESTETATATLEQILNFVASANDVDGTGFLFAVPERRQIVLDSIELNSPSCST